ncbi:MAG: DUF5686 family protein [Flavobacteriales bacterium]
MKTLLLILQLSLLSLVGVAQNAMKGRVIDASSKEALAFVAIYVEGSQNGVYSDIDGLYVLPNLKQSDKIHFRFLGYEEYVLVWKGESELNVVMKQQTSELAEIVIRPGENPAERIIRKAIENKEYNNPERAHSFTYESYNKLTFDIEADTTDPAYIRQLSDSSFVAEMEEMETFHLFLVESISKRKYLPPNHSEETIIANRVSGFQNADFALLGTQLQSFSFYGDYVEILSAKYLSPLTNGSYRKYLFIIEDTTYIEQDTVFTISFRPRKGKNFDGMKGQLFINTDGYALQNLLAEPNDDTESIGIKIQQRYEKVDRKAWFPIQLNSFITMNNLNVDGFSVVGEGRSYLQNIELDPKLKAKEFTPVTLMMLKDAKSQPDSVWMKYRNAPLDTIDLKTYHIIDSVSEAENFEKKMGILSAMMEGRIPLGYIDFDINRLMAANSYEGFRLGGGIHTSDKLSKVFKIGGYGAYGFKDKAWKYGGDLQFNIYKPRAVWLKFSAEHDVRETAGNRLINNANNFLFGDFYPFFITRMDVYEKYEVKANGRAYRNFTLTPFANVQKVNPYQDIYFYQNVSDNSSTVQVEKDIFQITEIGSLVRWAPGEKLVRMGKKEVSLGGRLPVFYFNFTKGISGLLDGEFDYTRYDASAEKRFLIKNAGELFVKIVGGRVEGDVPFSLLYNCRGSRSSANIAAPETFETMFTNAYQFRDFAAVHLRHSFKDLLFQYKNFKPHLILVHNMMWSTSEKPNNYSVDIKTVEKGYFESGLQIDGILKSGFSGIGIGGFYRYGPYAQGQFKNDFVFKLTTSFIF